MQPHASGVASPREFVMPERRKQGGGAYGL